MHKKNQIETHICVTMHKIKDELFLSIYTYIFDYANICPSA